MAPTWSDGADDRARMGGRTAEMDGTFLMQRLLLAAAVVVALLLTPIAAGAANPDYERWGWSRPAGPDVQFQWGEPMPRTRMSDDWVVNDCDGDAPFLCVRRDGGASGHSELSQFRISSDEQLSEDLAEGGRERALRRHARRYYRIFSDDREQGCPAAYTFTPLTINDATIAGRNGVRYGFLVRDGEGRTVERKVNFATVTRRDLVIVGMEGLNGNACLSPEGPTLRPRQLKAFEPYLARLAANGALPQRG